VEQSFTPMTHQPFTLAKKPENSFFACNATRSDVTTQYAQALARAIFDNRNKEFFLAKAFPDN